MPVRIDEEQRAVVGVERLFQLLGRPRRLERLRHADQAIGQDGQPLSEPGARPHEARLIADHDAPEIRDNPLEQEPVQRVDRMDARRWRRRWLTICSSDSAAPL